MTNHSEQETDHVEGQQRFYGDDRLYHPRPSDVPGQSRPWGRGQTEGTGLGMGPVVACIIVGAILLGFAFLAFAR